MLARQKAGRFPSPAHGDPAPFHWCAVRNRAEWPSGPPAESLRILQVTDTHLYRDADRTLLGVNTQRSLEQVLEQAWCEHGPADLMLATGDLVHDHAREGYARLRALLHSLGAPGYWVPGNHDDPQVMHEVLADAGVCDPRSVRVGRWQVVLLDSRIADGGDAGRVADAGLRSLDEDLGRYPDHHALVCLHHPPVPIGSRWMDAIGLQNAAELFAVLDRHPQVRAVLCGHIHQEFETRRAGVRILGSPSTCFQFRRRSDEFALDCATPGYRWLALRADGGIDTEVGYVEDFAAAADMASTGY